MTPRKRSEFARPIRFEWECFGDWIGRGKSPRRGRRLLKGRVEPRVGINQAWQDIEIGVLQFGSLAIPLDERHDRIFFFELFELGRSRRKTGFRLLHIRRRNFEVDEEYFRELFGRTHVELATRERENFSLNIVDFPFHLFRESCENRAVESNTNLLHRTKNGYERHFYI